MTIKKFKEMFSEMVEKKDVALIPVYYHPELLLYTNGQVTNYQEFLTQHTEYYATERTYQVEYDEETLLEQGNKVAARIWITVDVPGAPIKKLELILILQYQDGKIFRLWELTYPDWTQLPGFSE
jgi:hypothetical protein